MIFNRILLTGTLIGFLLGTSIGQAETLAEPTEGHSKGNETQIASSPGQVVVRLRLDTSLNELLQMTETVGATVERELTPERLDLLTFDESIPVAEMISRLQDYPAVLYAEPNYQIEVFHQPVIGRQVGLVAGQATPRRMPIAVIYTGFNPSHPALGGHLFDNPKEIAGDGVDNDGNGYIDDVHGYDFYDRDSNPEGVQPYEGYGTEVVEAILKGSRDAPMTFLPLRAGPGPWLSTAAICEAISYAIKRGVGVIHLSFGNWWVSRALLETLHDAAEHKVLLIAAAGLKEAHWPSAMEGYPGLIWVVTADDGSWNARFSSAKQALWRYFSDVIDKAIDLKVEVPNLSNVVPPRSTATSLTNNNYVGVSEGKVGQSASFNPMMGQFLWMADSPTLSMGETDFTMALWVKLDWKMGTIFLNKGDARANNSDEYDVRYNQTLGLFEFGVGNSHGSRHVAARSFGPPSVGNWYFLVCWYDLAKRTIRIQVNNGPIDMLRLEPGISSYDSPHEFTIGASAIYHDGYMNGRIDEVGIWKRILTDEERATLYNQGTGNAYDPSRYTFSVDRTNTLTDALVAYFPLEQGGFLWRFGHLTVDPFPFVSAIGFILFLFSFVRGIFLLF